MIESFSKIQMKLQLLKFYSWGTFLLLHFNVTSIFFEIF